MVLSSLLGSTLLRTQRSHIPQTFRRYKSLTAVIERGKQGGPDRPFRPRARAPPEEDGGERVKNREERRFEQHGPSSKSRNYSQKPWFKSSQDRDEKPRSSRFGRVGSPRSLEDAPSRFVKDREEGPFRSEDGFRPRREDNIESKPANRWQSLGSKSTFNRSSYEDRSERPDRPAYGSDGRPPRRERPSYGADDRPARQDLEGYGQRDERPPRREGGFEGRERRPFDRDNKFSDSRNRYSGGGNRRLPPREFSGRGEQEGRFDRKPRDESSSYTRETLGRDGARGSAWAQAGTAPAGDAQAQTASVRGLESLPYSTAASEFIYGYSSVLAAMKANRRKLYKLYVHSRGASRDGLMAKIRALKMFPITEEVGDEYLRAMDRASSGRPHNGVILESSPLPVPPITELRAASKEDESFSVKVGTQTTEDALINGNREIYSYKSAGWRHPLILYVDGVLDEGNLGAIARSAYFLGVDAVVTPTRQTAPWSQIALKASAGAAEAIPLFKVSEPSDFLGKSARAGWRIYASDAIPPPPMTAGTPEEPSSNIVYSIARSTKRLPLDHCPVAEHPTILMMGAEGTGLRDGLLNLAHYKVGIKHGREVDEVGVDSLNVSVAASILCYEMLQKPMLKPAANPEEVLF